MRTPCKIFGDVHGQFADLQRFFSAYGSPNPYTGDVEYVNYLFLGDYVDRGKYSLEVITFLVALKICHPREVVLLRGNHEDAQVNALYGFRSECRRRCHDGNAVWQVRKTYLASPLYLHVVHAVAAWWRRHTHPRRPLHSPRALHARSPLAHSHSQSARGGGRSVLSSPNPSLSPCSQAFNAVFEFLPVAAVVDDTILCLHGGIGDQLTQLSQLEALPRPVKVNLSQRSLLNDVLWSDPTEVDGRLGVHPNVRGPNTVTYGKDRVARFLEANGLKLLVRAHQCVQVAPAW